MFTYGLIILLLMIKRGESVRCEKLMPGLKRFQLGIDITKLDLMSIGPDEAEDGFRSNVVSYTCNQGRETALSATGLPLTSVISLGLLIGLLTIKARRSSTHLPTRPDPTNPRSTTSRTKSTLSRGYTLLLLPIR